MLRRLPTVVITLTGMTCRYVVLLVEVTLDMFQSRKSRIVGDLKATERRRVSTATAGVLLEKSMELSLDVHRAMQSRGYRGKSPSLERLQMRRLIGPRSWWRCHRGSDRRPW